MPDSGLLFALAAVALSAIVLGAYLAYLLRRARAADDDER